MRQRLFEKNSQNWLETRTLKLRVKISYLVSPRHLLPHGWPTPRIHLSDT